MLRPPENCTQCHQVSGLFSPQDITVIVTPKTKALMDNMQNLTIYTSKVKKRSGEMVQRLKAHTVLLKDDLSPVPSTRVS